MKDKLAIIGMGYVGLPLSVLFSKKYDVIGYDINTSKIANLQNGIVTTDEINSEELIQSLNNSHQLGSLQFTSNIKDLENCNIYIIAVPTPLDKYQKPDLSYLINASQTIGAVLKKGDIVIYESTVYPGVTEEECVPILETVSQLKFNSDFFVGYSPERVNPGDKVNTIDKITKITSGSTPEIATRIDHLYQSIITAGTHKVSSIKVAEASKVIENAQRDVNIAFINEITKILNTLNINTQEVLEAARTKWNFLDFRPGLVGGHCIGIDPFYLAEKAKSHGYNPELILASRRINDSMAGFVTEQVIKAMIKKEIPVKNSHILILGAAFKENCSDIRNSKVLDIYKNLLDYDCKIHIFDPIVSQSAIQLKYDLKTVASLKENFYDVIILAVQHNCFKSLNINKYKKTKSVVYDIKGVLGKDADFTL